MAEIKRRHSMVNGILTGMAHAFYKATTIEVVYLQFRKMLELIALGSLIANKDIFSKVYQDFSKYWNAELIIKDVERLNPHFYPHPIIQTPSSRPGVSMDWHSRPHDYLTKDDLIKLYKKCGAIMHCGNPYGSQLDYGYYEKRMDYWSERIRNLLNSHCIRLVNDTHLYLIQMGDENGVPSYNVFGYKGPP